MIKAENVLFLPLRIQQNFPIIKILENLNKIKDEKINLGQFHNIINKNLTNFTLENSIYMFLISKIIFEPEKNINEKLINNENIDIYSIRLFFYLQLIKNQTEKKKIKTNWKNSNHLNDSFLIDNPNNEKKKNIKSLIPNFFQNNLFFEKDLQNEKFFHKIKSIFLQEKDLEVKKLLKFDNLKLDFNKFQKIQDLSHKVIVIENDNLEENNNLILSNCQNCSIYVKTLKDLVYIYKCKNSEIFISGVKKITLLENCSDIKLTAITKILTLNNVLDSSINSYSDFKINLLGEIKNVKIGPYNANFLNIYDILKNTKIELNKENTEKFKEISIFYKVQNFIDFKNNSFSIIKPEEYKKMLLPNTFSYYPASTLITNENFLKLSKHLSDLVNQCAKIDYIIPLLVPNDFLEFLLKKVVYFLEFKKKIANNSLNESQRDKLMFMVQGHFREWLLSKPKTNDLLRVISNVK